MKKDTKPADTVRIGVISDTQGLLRPEALPLLAASDRIIHGVFLNPGSAGPRRFKQPISVAELLINNGTVSARSIEITPP